jgi:alpha-L-rhamnosidase
MSFTATNLKCEAMVRPLGIDIRTPRLSWIMQSDKRNVEQTAYQLILSETEAEIKAGKGTFFDSGKVASSDTFCVLPRPIDSSACVFYWTVRVWNNKGDASDWANTEYFEMGLLDRANWTAAWIEPDQREAYVDEPRSSVMDTGFGADNTTLVLYPNGDIDEDTINPCQMLRKEFELPKEVKSARAYATARGCYQMEINGKRVGDYELSPEATPYFKYLQYQTYDVGAFLKKGKNAIGAFLADGWWSSRIGNDGCSRQYGDRLAFLMQINIEYTDGSTESIISDNGFSSWDGGPLRFSDLNMGEKYDARKECNGWSSPGFDDLHWQPVTEKDYDMDALAGQNAEHIKVTKVIKPIKIYTSPKGETMIDFGQVIAGNAKITFSGKRGQLATLSYTEQTEKDGSYNLSIMGRNNPHRDYYVFKGDGEETYEPRFTYRGFRYVRVEGHEKLNPEKIEARLICSDLDVSGEFSCSDARVSKLQSNILWTTLTNMVSIPTDNPDRERAGWTGDAQMFGNTACFNLDMQAFWRRWLAEMRLEQTEEGSIPLIIPYWRGYGENGLLSAAGWGDVCIILPWTCYQFYGDKRILEENYDMMTKWINYVRKIAETRNPDDIGEVSPERAERLKLIWNTGFQWGDWLTPTANLNTETGQFRYNVRPLYEMTPSFYFATSTELMSKIAATLGKADDSVYYKTLSDRIKEASIKEFFESGFIMKSGYQGASILALKAGFVPEGKEQEVINRLLELIKNHDGRMDTGFSSTQHLLDTLVEHGKVKEAFDLLFQDKIPSWLYEVDKGATGIWESWVALSEQDDIRPVSFSQYANGCIGEWMYKSIGGLECLEPGYRKVKFEPIMDSRINAADISYSSVNGKITGIWKMDKDMFTYDIEIPPNTQAEVHLPGAKPADVQVDGTSAKDHPDIHGTEELDGKTVLKMGSGKYSIQYVLH